MAADCFVGSWKVHAAACRALGTLAAWLQLYTLGDPEAAEAELADDLAAIHRDALGKASKAGALYQICLFFLFEPWAAGSA